MLYGKVWSVEHRVLIVLITWYFRGSECRTDHRSNLNFPRALKERSISESWVCWLMATRSFFSNKSKLMSSFQLLNKNVHFWERSDEKRLTDMEVHIFLKNVQLFLLLENDILVQGWTYLTAAGPWNFVVNRIKRPHTVKCFT